MSDNRQTDNDDRSNAGDAAVDTGEDLRGPDDGLLVLQNLTKTFGGLTAVDDLSFHVESGEILGFIGPNGAGKSTTFNCVTGTFPPTSGTVWYDGEETTGLPAHQMVDRGLVRTYQSLRVFDDRTVLENVVLPLVPDKMVTLSGFDDTYRQRAGKICERVGLGDRRHQMPSELPHAGLLRLELGRALASDPDLLLVDEPFAGLAQREVDEISNLLKSLRDDRITLVVVDHNMRGLLELVDRAIVIRFGSKIVEGAPEAITEDEQVQQAYLGGNV